MGWRQTVVGVAALLVLATIARAGEIEPPDYLAELKAKKDTTTIRSRSFGVVVSGELGAPWADKISALKSHEFGAFHSASTGGPGSSVWIWQVSLVS